MSDRRSCSTIGARRGSRDRGGPHRLDQSTAILSCIPIRPSLLSRTGRLFSSTRAPSRGGRSARRTRPGGSRRQPRRPGRAPKDLFGSGDELLLPTMDQRGMYAVLAGRLVDCAVPLEGRRGDLGLERRRADFPLTCHRVPSSGPRVSLNSWSENWGPLDPGAGRCPGPEEEPQDERHQRHAADRHNGFRRVHWPYLPSCRRENPLSRGAFVTTLTLESAIASDARIGLKSQPVSG